MTRSRSFSLISFSLITLKISDCVATTGTRRGGMETAKLERLVSKLLREGAARKEDGVQPLMNVLLARHVEYQRKPQHHSKWFLGVAFVVCRCAGGGVEVCRTRGNFNADFSSTDTDDTDKLICRRPCAVYDAPAKPPPNSSWVDAGSGEGSGEGSTDGCEVGILVG